jgi:hypothetical protein
LDKVPKEDGTETVFHPSHPLSSLYTTFQDAPRPVPGRPQSQAEVLRALSSLVTSAGGSAWSTSADANFIRKLTTLQQEHALFRLLAHRGRNEGSSAAAATTQFQQHQQESQNFEANLLAPYAAHSHSSSDVPASFLPPSLDIFIDPDIALSASAQLRQRMREEEAAARRLRQQNGEEEEEEYTSCSRLIDGAKLNQVHYFKDLDSIHSDAELAALDPAKAKVMGCNTGDEGQDTASASVPLLVIIRHGRTEHNKLGLFTGWEDASLAPEGRDEARAAGKLLRQHNIEVERV